MYLPTDAQNSTGEVDVLRRQPEDLTLPQPAAQREHDCDAVPRLDGVPYALRGLQRPGFPLVLRHLGPAHGLGPHRVARRALVVDGGLEDVRERGEDLAGVSRRTFVHPGCTVCHGWAGLLLAAERIAADASNDAIKLKLPRLYSRLSDCMVRQEIPVGTGLLTGADGVLLALHTLNPSHPVDVVWETCLLLN
ncbi:hypothetical protein AB0D27_15110 [Streptomyces sp. NPDC048415]|uniref:hypothetical protein n=1 Tax=Streptomyces sp. NPDC048415 TaxID=3154822 RepID=UPI00341D24C2